MNFGIYRNIRHVQERKNSASGTTPQRERRAVLATIYPLQKGMAWRGVQRRLCVRVRVWVLRGGEIWNRSIGAFGALGRESLLGR